MLRHLAIIMDGNGRWAMSHNKPRTEGHRRGVEVVDTIVQCCVKKQIKYLSLFVFSTENWKRPPDEVSGVMQLLFKTVQDKISFLKENNIRIQIVGDLSLLDSQLQESLEKLVEDTKNHSGLNLILAINYGGRAEIVRATKRLVEKIQKKELRLEEVSEKTLGSLMDTSIAPPPDLIIRTGNEHRLSNFYMWSSAYSEIFWSEKMWPDFNELDLLQVIEQFGNVQRNFGGIAQSDT